MRRLLALAAVLFAGSHTAHATITTYSDRSSWLTGVTGITTIDFSGPAPGTIVDYSTATGYVSGDVSITGIFGPSTYNLFVVTANVSSPWYDWGSGSVIRNGDNDPMVQRSIRITLANNTTAFGLDLMTGNENGQTVEVLVNGTTWYSVPTNARPSRAFFGLVSDTAITEIQFFNPSPYAYLMLDNISSGSAASTASVADTPEGSSFLLLGSGLAALGAFVRRSRAAGSKS